MGDLLTHCCGTEYNYHILHDIVYKSYFHVGHTLYNKCWYNRLASQFPHCAYSISHNAPFRTEICTFLFWMVHCRIWNRCIVGFVNLGNKFIVLCRCFPDPIILLRRNATWYSCGNRFSSSLITDHIPMTWYNFVAHTTLYGFSLWMENATNVYIYTYL